MELQGKPDGPGSPTDHGGLTGLGDDDHSQYHTDARGDARYWPLSTDLATQTELNDHLGDALDAHDASAISVADAGGNFDGVNVETVLAEIVTNQGTAISALDAHLNDPTDAHDASAISILDVAGEFTATNVEAALVELEAEKTAVNSALINHIADPTAAHASSAVSYDPTASGAAAITAQAAIDELFAEKLDAGVVMQDGDAAGGVLDGTYPNPGLAASVAGDGLLETANVLSVRVDDSTIQVNADLLRVKAGGITAAHVAADVATQAELDAHVNDISDAHDASAISIADVGGLIAADNVEGALAELATDADNHLADGTDAHDASAISVLDTDAYFTATNVETVLKELYELGVVADHGGLTGLGDDDHAQYHTDARGDARYWPLSTDLATQAELNAHLADVTDVHTAAGITFTPHGSIAATNVQAAIQEVRDEASAAAAHKATHEDGGADEISIAGLAGISAELAAHLADTTAPHAATSLTILDTGGYYTTDNVEEALRQIGASGGAGGFPTASDVAIVDAGANYTATNVETALAEVMDAVEAAGGSVAADEENLILHMGVFA